METVLPPTIVYDLLRFTVRTMFVLDTHHPFPFFLYIVADPWNAGQINSPKGIIAVTIPDGTKSGDTLQIPLPA